MTYDQRPERDQQIHEIGQAYDRGDAEAIHALLSQIGTADEPSIASVRHFATAHVAAMESRYQDAYTAYDAAFEAFERLGDDNRAGDMHSFKSLAAFYSGDFDVALTSALKALEIHERIGANWSVAR